MNTYSVCLIKDCRESGLTQTFSGQPIRGGLLAHPLSNCFIARSSRLRLGSQRFFDSGRLSPCLTSDWVVRISLVVVTQSS